MTSKFIFCNKVIISEKCKSNNSLIEGKLLLKYLDKNGVLSKMIKSRLTNYRDIIIFGLLIWLKALAFRLIVLSPILVKGMFADLLMTLIILSLATVVASQKIRPYVLFGFNFILSLIWFSASTYSNYYGSIPTYLTLTSLGQVGQIGASISASIEPVYYIYALDIVIIIALFVYKLINRKPHAETSQKPARKYVVIYSSIVLAIALLLSAALIRQTKIITNELELARHLGMFHYQIAFALTNENARATKKVLTEAERQQLVDEIRTLVEHDNNGEKLYYGAAKDTNVIAIQLEAFQNFVINLEVNGQVITPFLNEFIKNNFYFNHIYQQIGEGNTSDAEFLFNTGAYPQGHLAMSKIVGNKEVQSLPRFLKQYDYSTYTFHVNDVTFWNRNELYPALGFDKYYDKQSFENDEFNFFGASDEELYRVAFNELSEKVANGEKVFSHIITTSGHHPFVIPEQYQTLDLPTSLEGTQLGHYLQAAHYVDEQLKLFVEKLQGSGLLDTTTLVIYGDHFGLQQQDNPADWVSEQLSIQYHDTLSRFNIPLIIAVPHVKGETVELTGGQVDIAPTLLNLLGLSHANTNYVLFGQDLINSTTNTIGIRYYMPTGTFINEDVLYTPGDSFETGKAINIHTYEPVEDLSLLKEDYDYIMKLMKESDLYTSQYPSLIQENNGKEGDLIDVK